MLLLLLFTIKNRFSFLFDFLRLPRTLGSPLILFSFFAASFSPFCEDVYHRVCRGGGMLLKSIEKPKAKRRKKSSSSPKAIKVVCVCGTSSVCHSETGFSRQQVQVSIFTKNEFNEISSRISCAFALDVLWAVSEILASKVPETYRGSWHFMTSPHPSNLAASRCHINIK